MKVIITKCSGVSYWYHNRIGETFDVIGTTSRAYSVAMESSEYYGHIYHNDCIMLDELRQDKLNEILDGEVKSSMH